MTEEMEKDANVMAETPVTWSGLAVMGSHPHEMSCHRKPLHQIWTGEMLPHAKRWGNGRFLQVFQDSDVPRPHISETAKKAIERTSSPGHGRP